MTEKLTQIPDGFLDGLSPKDREKVRKWVAGEGYVVENRKTGKVTRPAGRKAQGDGAAVPSFVVRLAGLGAFERLVATLLDHARDGALSRAVHGGERDAVSVDRLAERYAELCRVAEEAQQAVERLVKLTGK